MWLIILCLIVFVQGCVPDTSYATGSMEVEEKGGESKTQKSIAFLLITKFSKEVGMATHAGSICCCHTPDQVC